MNGRRRSEEQELRSTLRDLSRALNGRGAAFALVTDLKAIPVLLPETPKHDDTKGNNPMRKFLLSMAIAGGSLFMATAPAFAGTVSSPVPDSSGSYLVANSPTDPDGPGPLQAGWTPASFDITASGFPVGSIVYVQICSGVDPTTPGWDPVADCDSATVPAAGFADASGSFVFNAANENYRLPMFRGDSPQEIFQCVSPEEKANNTVPNPTELAVFDNCQIRVSSNHLNFTSDQSFLRFRLTEAGVGPDPEVPEVPFAVLLPLSALAVGGGLLVVRKRRMAGSVVA